MYARLSTLSWLIRDTLQPIANRGFDCAVILYYTDKQFATFISSPNPSYLFVQTYDFDLASPLSAAHHKSTLWDAPYVGAKLLHFRDLDHVLRGLSKRICAEINCLEQNGGGAAMTRYDISTRSRSIGDLVALLKEHPQGIEI